MKPNQVFAYHDKLLARQDLAKSVGHFVQACRSSRIHNLVAADCYEKYGNHGAQISGCVRDHFPEDIKEHLRGLAKDVTHWSDMAWAARPKGVRKVTMRALGQAVATRDGAGFYGPQPYRAPLAIMSWPLHR